MGGTFFALNIVTKEDFVPVQLELFDGNTKLHIGNLGDLETNFKKRGSDGATAISSKSKSQTSWIAYPDGLLKFCKAEKPIIKIFSSTKSYEIKDNNFGICVVQDANFKLKELLLSP